MEEKEMNALTYDYKVVKVKREMEEITTDVYSNLGWELTNTSSVEGSIFSVNLSFKRNRKLANKTELLKLQAKVDDSLSTIENLQNKKKKAGFVSSLSTGIVGTLIFGGGLSMAMLLKGALAMVGGIALGVVGIGVCALAYPIFKRNNKKTNQNIAPIIDNEFDKLTDLCEQAAKLKS